MIVRIVKMRFRTEKVAVFLALFEERKQLIRHFDGCNHLELWQDAQDPTIFFTYSIWESEKHLDHYRFSELFRDTWARTRILFYAGPEAWSLNRKMEVE